MKRSLPRLNLILAIIALLWVAAVLAAPLERTLGVTLRWVFAHASLTQVSLLLFLIAGVMSIAFLIGWRKLYDWMEITGWSALGFWLAGFVLSMFAARLAWGVWIDFGEPRTQMTLRVLAVGVLFIVLTVWVDHRWFTAIAQLILSALILYLNRSTSVIRHPFNPIGQSEDPSIPLSYSLIFLLALIWAGLFILYLVYRRAASQVQSIQSTTPSNTEITSDL